MWLEMQKCIYAPQLSILEMTEVHKVLHENLKHNSKI